MNLIVNYESISSLHLFVMLWSSTQHHFSGANRRRSQEASLLSSFLSLAIMQKRPESGGKQNTKQVAGAVPFDTRTSNYRSISTPQHSKKWITCIICKADLVRHGSTSIMHKHTKQRHGAFLNTANVDSPC